MRIKSATAVKQQGQHVNLKETVEICQQRNPIDDGINSYIDRNVHDSHYCNNILLTGTDFPIFAQKVELE